MEKSEGGVIFIFVQTHRLIAQLIASNVNTRFDNKIDELRFQYGSIAPDFMPFNRNIPHYKNESFAFVSQTIKNLLNMDANRNMSRSKDWNQVFINLFSSYGTVINERNKESSIPA